GPDAAGRGRQPPGAEDPARRRARRADGAPPRRPIRGDLRGRTAASDPRPVVASRSHLRRRPWPGRGGALGRGRARTVASDREPRRAVGSYGRASFTPEGTPISAPRDGRRRPRVPERAAPPRRRGAPPRGAPGARGSARGA